MFNEFFNKNESSKQAIVNRYGGDDVLSKNKAI